MKKDLDEARRRFEKLLGHPVDDDHSEQVEFVAHLTSRSFTVHKRSGLPYPNAKRLRPILDRLVNHLGRPLKKCIITVWSDGPVFVDGNTCLGDPKYYRD